MRSIFIFFAVTIVQFAYSTEHSSQFLDVELDELGEFLDQNPDFIVPYVPGPPRLIHGSTDRNVGDLKKTDKDWLLGRYILKRINLFESDLDAYEDFESAKEPLLSLVRLSKLAEIHKGYGNYVISVAARSVCLKQLWRLSSISEYDADEFAALKHLTASMIYSVCRDIYSFSIPRELGDGDVAELLNWLHQNGITRSRQMFSYEEIYEKENLSAIVRMEGYNIQLHLAILLRMELSNSEDTLSSTDITGSISLYSALESDYLTAFRDKYRKFINYRFVHKIMSANFFPESFLSLSNYHY